MTVVLCTLIACCTAVDVAETYRKQTSPEIECARRVVNSEWCMEYLRRKPDRVN